MSTNVKTRSAASTGAQSQAVKSYATDALVGSGWQNDNSPFINITFDRDTNLNALAAELASGKSLSLIPRKSVFKSRTGQEYPANKYVVALRSQQ